MANITKTASGKYKFIATVNYKQHSKTFATKAEGYAWVESIESGKGKVPVMTFGELLNKYCDDVSSKKKGERWERIRIAKFQSDKLSKVNIADLTKPLFADWRDRRLKEVSA